MILEEDNPALGGGQPEDEEMREGNPQKDALGGSANAPSKETDRV